MSRVNGIMFDGKHSYYDFGMWLSERPDWGSPAPKLNIVEIPGADGILDLSEANAGEIKFHNRIITLTFSAMVKVGEQEQFKSHIRNALHGRVIQQIIPDEDPEWYYRGRCTVEFVNIASWKLQIIITIDANPYVMKVNETVVNLNDQNVPTETNKIIRAQNTNAGDNYLAWSNFYFGTSQFPEGVVFGNGDDLIISWPKGATVRGHTYAQFSDSEGGYYTKSLSPYISVAYDGSYWRTTAAGSVHIPISELESNNINPAKVYRLYIEMNLCEFYTEDVVGHYRVWNSRKSVVPVFHHYIGYQNTVVTVNGRDFTVTEGDSMSDEIVLREGWNDVYAEGELPASEPSLTMSFREGRL